MNFLACDLGGTKVLIGIYKNENSSQGPKLLLKAKYRSKDWDSFYSILDDFFKNKFRDLSPITACFAVAGIVRNKSAKITNLSWEISESELKNKYNFKEVELINDFAVLIYGIPHLKKTQYKTLLKGADSNNKNRNFHTVVGAGTGLGIARGIILKDKIEVFASEGGHVEFAPKSKDEWELKNWIKKYLNLKRVSTERIISGEGLSLIARWRFNKSDINNHPFQEILKRSENENDLSKDLPLKIHSLSKKGDIFIMEIIKIWLDAYSSFLGDVATHELCFGGLWISGGIAPKYIKYFISNSFLKQFSNKGRLKDIVNSIPVKIILDEEFGLYGAACRANILQKNINK